MKQVCTPLIAALLICGSVSAQTVVTALDNWTISPVANDYRNSALNVASVWGIPGVSYQSGFLLFAVSEFPDSFASCELQIYQIEHASGRAMIDVLAIPRPFADSSYNYFTPDFQAPYFYCGSFEPPTEVHSLQTIGIEIGDCIRQAMNDGAPFVLVQLSSPLPPGGAGTFVVFAPLLRYGPPSYPEWHEPRLVFTGAVSAEKSSLGGVKGLFR